MHRYHLGQCADDGDGREVLDVVKGQVFDEQWKYRVRRAHREQQCVSVWRCLGDNIRAYRGESAGAVVNYHRLPERLADAVARRAGDRVGGATGRKRHDEAHRLAWVGLGKGKQRGK